MSIKVNHLSKKYGEQLAVDQISFEVSKGEIVGFLGPNGAGKSTTMKMITGYLASDGGEVHVCGIQVQGEAIETKNELVICQNPIHFILKCMSGNTSNSLGSYIMLQD